MGWGLLGWCQMDASAERVVVYDPTCRGRGLRPGLSHAWAAGVHLYRGWGRISRWIAARTWAEAFAGLAQGPPGVALAEVQIWSHGKWGLARLGEDVFDGRWLLRDHPERARLAAVRRRFAPGARWWFRTCETAGARRGQAFVADLADDLGVRVVAHTYIIGVWQSGLRAVAPGARAEWSPWEGLAEGTPDAPVRARPSRPWSPSTVHFLSPEPVPL